MYNIMITDDAMFMRNVLKNLLVEAGYNIVAEATNGLQAVELYDKYQPDLVTMDLTMPEMDGISALKQIRAKHPDARIIMCSAMGQQALVVDAIKAGAKDFVVKPFQKENILQKIREVLNRS